MSFFKVLCALLKASPAKLVFPDEAKAKEAFLARYGEECDQQGLEDNCTLQFLRCSGLGFFPEGLDAL